MTAQFFTTERIGRTREKTPEGYLLCRDVPISRVGVFDYSPLEVGIQGVGGRVHVTRSADELFRPETMASFEGKPIVLGHGVFPDASNWGDVSQGHIQNVRRGEGEQSSMLLADLLIQKQEAIELVESGVLEQVSCGYDSKLIADGVGEGHQEGIVGNHLALVTKARCSGCQIGDGSMERSKPKSWKTALRRFFKDSDEEGFNEALDALPTEVKDESEAPAPEPETDPNAERFDKLEKQVAALIEQVAALQKPQEAEPEPVADEAPAAEEEKKSEPSEDEKEASDDEASSVFGDAETINPGMKRPQGDAASGKFSVGLLKRVKREAIKASGITAFGDAAALDGAALDMAFKGALEVVKTRRNPVANGSRIGDSAPKRMSNAALNDSFAKYWSISK